MSARLIDVAPGPVVGVAGTSDAAIGDGSIVTVTVPSSNPSNPSPTPVGERVGADVSGLGGVRAPVGGARGLLRGRRSRSDTTLRTSPSASVSPSSTSIATGVSWVVVAASSSATGCDVGPSDRDRDRRLHGERAVADLVHEGVGRDTSRRWRVRQLRRGAAERSEQLAGGRRDKVHVSGRPFGSTADSVIGRVWLSCTE